MPKTDENGSTVKARDEWFTMVPPSLILLVVLLSPLLYDLFQ